jgi:beta-lactamase class A
MPSRDQNPYHNYYYSDQRTRSARTPLPHAPGRPGAPAPRRPRRRLRRFVAFFILATLLIVGFHFALTHHVSTGDGSPPVATTKKVVTKTVAAPTIDLTTLNAQISSVIQQNSNIDFSVSTIDLTNNQTMHYGDSSAFTAASVTKLITAADFLNEVQNGQQTLTETINGSSAEYELQQMIVVSDDNAWDALNTQLGYTQLQNYADSLGLTSFQAIPNTITSDNIASLLKQLYNGKLLSASNTSLLLGWLKQANYRTYVVPAVPASDTIYHKIGLYEDFVNDATIITNGKQTVVLVIFTNGNGAYNWPARALMMQQIAKAVIATYLT